MSKILLTGTAGFIGSKVAHFLLAEGNDVVGLDNLNDYYDVRLKEFRLSNLIANKKFSYHKIDIENFKELQKIFSGNKFDAIINLAARAGVRSSIENPFVYVTTNELGTLNLLELMKEFNVKKIVTASSSSLYAGQPMPFKEDMDVSKPISPYAATKRSMELMCYTYNYLYNIDVSMLRYFTVYGPAGRPDMAIFRFIKWIDEGTPIQLNGDGSQSRDFTFVDDIAKGTIKALKPLGYEIFNLGGGKSPYSINYVINEIEKGLGKKAKIEYNPFHKADVDSTWADIAKAKEVLDWGPTISVNEGIKKTIEWYKNNNELIKIVGC